MFGKCVPIQKKKTTRKQGGRKKKICASHTLSGYPASPNSPRSFPRCNTGLSVYFGIQAPSLLSRDEEDWLAQTSNRRGNTGLQRFAASLYVFIFSTQLYTDTTVTCTCALILAFLRSRTGHNMFKAFITPLCITIALFSPPFFNFPHALAHKFQ